MFTVKGEEIGVVPTEQFLAENCRPGHPWIDGVDGEDIWPIPGPPGLSITGSPGITIVGRDGEDGEDAWPIPGRDGLPGSSGITVFWGQDGEDGEDAPIIPGRDGLSLIGPLGPVGNDADDRIFAYIQKLFEINGLMAFTPEEMEV